MLKAKELPSHFGYGENTNSIGDIHLQTKEKVLLLSCSS